MRAAGVKSAAFRAAAAACITLAIVAAKGRICLCSGVFSARRDGGLSGDRMRRYFAYIFRQLIGPMLVVTFSLTSVIWLTQSLRFIDLIINKGLSFWLFLYLTLLLLPSLLTVILPVALFAAVLYTYHRLLVDSEITVFQASGLSNARLAAPAMAMALLVMALG